MLSLPERHICGRHRQCVQDRLLRIPGAQQPNRAAHAADDVSVDHQLLAGGARAGPVRLQSTGHAVSDQRSVLPLQVGRIILDGMPDS